MSNAPVITVLEPGYSDYETERTVLAPFGAEVVAIGHDVAAVPLLRDMSPTALLVRERVVDTDHIEACPELKTIVRYGVGIDNIDLEAARRREVAVANIPDYGAEQEVSDHALALYLAVARRIVTRDAEVRAGRWSVGQSEIIYGHRGATLGLVGFGRIAKATCRKFAALGFSRVLVSDPSLSADEARPFGIEIADVDEICGQADVVSLHAPLTDTTRNIIDARRIGLLKPNAILVNTARGGLVDEAALADALRAGRIFGAGIDVYETEPPGAGHPLFALPNVVVSDHAGWYSEDSVRSLQTQAAEEVARVLRGERPLNWVNPW